MSDGTRNADRLAEPTRRALAAVSRPVGRGLVAALEPLDRLFRPGANAFNRRLGTRFGEVTGLQFALLAAATLALLTAPVWAASHLRVLAIAAVWAIFAMGWDVQSGYTGYISFGHSVLSGAAAYASAILLNSVAPDLPLWLSMPSSVAVALVVGMLIALPTLRLRGPYFSLITFVAVLLFYRLLPAFSEVTGGELGLRVQVLTYDPVLRYYYVLVPMLVIAAALTYVARSDVGTVLVAIRENEAAVASAGIDPTKFKLWSFALSSVPMGIGGVLLAHFGGQVDPTTFVVVDNSIEMIAMAVVGGMSSILGPLAGAFTFVLLRDAVLTGLGHTGRWIALWLLVLFVLVFARRGLFRLLWHALGAVGGDRE